MKVNGRWQCDGRGGCVLPVPAALYYIVSTLCCSCVGAVLPVLPRKTSSSCHRDRRRKAGHQFASLRYR